MNDKIRALPDFLSQCFWDCDFHSLRWSEHKNFIIKRIINYGSLEALIWLRNAVRHDELKRWFIERQGQGIEKRQLRYWEVMLSLPHDEVTKWLRDPARYIWDNR